MTDKRVAYVRCSREWLADYLFKTKKVEYFKYWCYIDEPDLKFFRIPKDLKVVGMEYRTIYDSFNIVFESPDFEEVKPDAVVPQVVTMIEEETKDLSLRVKKNEEPISANQKEA